MKPSEMVVGKWYQMEMGEAWTRPMEFIVGGQHEYTLRDADGPLYYNALTLKRHGLRECCPHGRGLDETCGECRPIRFSAGKCGHGYDPNCLACHAEKLAMLELCASHDITTEKQLQERLCAMRYGNAVELIKERDELRANLARMSINNTDRILAVEKERDELGAKLAAADEVINEWRRAGLLPAGSTPTAVADHIRMVAASYDGHRLRAEKAEAELQRVKNIDDEAGTWVSREFMAAHGLIERQPGMATCKACADKIIEGDTILRERAEKAEAELATTEQELAASAEFVTRQRINHEATIAECERLRGELVRQAGTRVLVRQAGTLPLTRVLASPEAAQIRTNGPVEIDPVLLDSDAAGMKVAKAFHNRCNHEALQSSATAHAPAAQRGAIVRCQGDYEP